VEGDLVRINEWLTPLSWLYGMGVGINNTLFDMGIRSTRSYNIPIISLGNLTVGGTGKTPHTEYLIRLLSKKHKVAVLSRGYKRKSKGYILADIDTPMEKIGDEPWQMKQKFPHVYIAVDKSRRHGIERLCHDEKTKDVDVILLDDAYQHRQVTPGVNILLVDYHRMITDDKLLPAGRLREPVKNKRRANMVIVTKCPHDIKPMGFRVVQKALDLRPYQKLYFSTLRYDNLTPIFSKKESRPIESLTAKEHVMLLTGIASPEQMALDLEHYAKHIVPISYADHHYFSKEDAIRINKRFAELPKPSLIITTEKDAARLRLTEGLSDEVREAIYTLPVKIEILRNEAQSFNEKITGYVLKNSRNSILAKGQNEY